MKRLLAQIGITYFSVLAAAFYLPRIATLILIAAAGITAVVLFAVKKARKTVFLPAVALTVVIACAVNLCYTALAVKPVTEKYGGAVHRVTAVLADEPYQSYSKHYYRLRMTAIDGEEAGGKLLLKTPRALDADPDDVLTFTSELKIVENDYYRAKGYFLMADEYGITVDIEPADTHSLYYHANRLRGFLRRTLDRYLPEDCSALCRAVLIGDKYALDSDIRDDFRYAGASYFIVVSGMHFAVLCMLLMNFLNLFRRFINRWVRLVILVMFMLVYAAITGFQPSVVRSGVMMLFTVIGLTVRRQAYPLNHLGIAGIVMPLFFSPYCAGDSGLILSFYATLSILLWAKPIAMKLCRKDENGAILRFEIGDRLHSRFKSIWARIRRKKPEEQTKKETFSWRIFCQKLWNSLMMLLSVCLAANILVFPITVFLFQEFSLVTLLSGILLYAEIYLILILSLLVCLFGWFKLLAIVFSVPLALLCRLVLWIVDSLASLPFAYCRVTSAFVYIWLTVTLLMALVVILCRNHYRYLKAAVLCSLTILLAGGLTHAVLQMQTFSLEVYACGRGICAAVNDGGNLHILSMNAKSEYLYPLWDRLSHRYSGAQTALCLSENELKHYRMYSDDEFAISTLLLYDKNGYDADDDNMIVISGNTKLLLDNDLTLDVAAADDTAAVYVTAGEKHILLIPDGCAIEDIPEQYRTADVIVLSSCFDGADRLSCDRLVISDDTALGYLTADALTENYHQVYLTDQGDLTLHLR